MNVDTYLREHPYFYKKEKETSKTVYYFNKNGEGASIVVDNHFDLDEEEPIASNTQRSDFWDSTGFWIRKILYKAIELYYKQHRIRYVTSNKKQPLDSLHWAFSLIEEDGKVFYNHFFALKNTSLSIEDTFYYTLISFGNHIENYGYQLVIEKEKNDKIFFHITEK